MNNAQPAPHGPHPRANRFAALVEDLYRDGFAVAEACLEDDLVAALAAEAVSLDRAGRAHEAGIGRGEGHARIERIRRTRIHWLDWSSPAQRRLQGDIEAIRLEINRRLMLGLFEFEAQFAVYDPGDFYKRHLDSFRGARNRLVTFVAYLNEGWQEDDGGALAIWSENAPASSPEPPVRRVLPRGGTVSLLLSEEIPHEVEPARRQRLAIAGWWRVNASVGGRIDPPL